MRPNIVVIMTDQQRADHAAREGFALDTTPCLDGLARDGAWFNRAWTPVPACLPARISFLTGRFPSATRVRCNQQPAKPLYDQDLPELMRAAGYRTALCGKNHSHLSPDSMDYWSPYGHGGGSGDGRTPDEEAFDAYLKELHHRADFHPAPGGLECQVPYRATRDAMRWIESLGGEPFFLWLSFPEPHNPYQVPEAYFDLFPPDELPPLATPPEAWREKGFKWQHCRRIGERAFPDYDEQLVRARSNYCGMLRLIDDQVARFVKFLDGQGLRDDTLLIFVSDHGDFVGEYGLVRKGPETPDVLMRVPCLFNGPGIVASEVPRPEHVSLVDLLPTIAEAVGQPLPAGCQGRSLWPLLTGQESPAEEFASVYGEQGMGGLHYINDTELVDPTDDGLQDGVSFDCLNSRTQSGTLRTVRKGDWKLDFDMQGHGQLYCLADDPYELLNRYGDPAVADVEREMLAELLAWTLRVADPLPLPVRRYALKTDPHGWWAPYR